MGSAPNIVACAVPQPHHASSQGFVQALGVIIDTILVCSATALLILLFQHAQGGFGRHRHGAHSGGADLSYRCVRRHLHRDRDLLLRLHLDHRQLLLCRERVDLSGPGEQDRAYGAAVARDLDGRLGRDADGGHRVRRGGCVHGPDGDDQPDRHRAALGHGGEAHEGLFAQRDAGQEPVFHSDDYPELTGEIDREIWRRQGCGGGLRDAPPLSAPRARDTPHDRQ